ncbi:hypothetical protein BAE44_0002770 [Dichanthelium oligosanthes]|uniref:Uncharacterized protein n=1 Tax=Dichanthelium oligosanthes TaxID=888268 RepID=A0A1E5WFP2_9POAL|nr:hypothetical protein BAE44_0002770 [Dichanthelium oligosanthes]
MNVIVLASSRGKIFVYQISKPHMLWVASVTTVC